MVKEHSVVQFTASETLGGEDVMELLIPVTATLLEPVDGFDETKNTLFLSWDSIAWWLSHKYYFGRI